MRVISEALRADDGAGESGPAPAILSRRRLPDATAASAAVAGLALAPSTASAATKIFLYKERDLVEWFFNKLLSNYRGFVILAAIAILLR
jgi:hypothetical protein